MRRPRRKDRAAPPRPRNNGWKTEASLTPPGWSPPISFRRAARSRFPPPRRRMSEWARRRTPLPPCAPARRPRPKLQQLSLETPPPSLHALITDGQFLRPRRLRIIRVRRGSGDGSAVPLTESAPLGRDSERVAPK